MDQRSDQDQGQDQDQDQPNQNANKEPAEGSRETVRENQESAQRGSGITNRPLAREQQEQAEVPPRGKTKDEERDERE